MSAGVTCDTPHFFTVNIPANIRPRFSKNQHGARIPQQNRLTVSLR